jgi:hypothetical protein
MTDDDAFEDLAIPRDLAAVLLAELARTMVRIEDADIKNKPDHAPLPRGLISCGEAARYVPVLMALLRQNHKDLWEPGALAIALQQANLTLVTTRPKALN